MRGYIAITYLVTALVFLAATDGQQVDRSATGGAVPRAQAPSTTPTPTHITANSGIEDHESPMTSTTDSLSVNLDELTNATTTAESLDDSATTTNPSTEDSDSTGDSANEGLGIESRKVSGSAEANESNGKMVETNEESDEDDKPSASSVIQTTKKPSPRINMTQVDQIYVEARKDEKEIVESWDRMGKKLKKSVGNLIGSMVPFALNMSQEAKISTNCSGAVLKWVLSMNQLKSWALRMLDASGKPIAGLLEGSLTMFGNYRQCLKIRAPDDDEIEFTGEFKEYFRGKYCVVQAKPWLPEKSRFYNFNTKIKALMESSNDEENPSYDKSVFDELSEWALAFNFVNIRMDLCVPSLCSREDLQKAINFLIRGIDLKVRILRCEMDPMDGGYGTTLESGKQLVEADPDAAALSDSSNQGGKLSQTATRAGWLIVPLFAVVVVLLATAASTAIGKSKMNRLSHTITSLSLGRSINSHLDVDYDQLADDKPLALYGVRFILVVWVILVESAVNLKFEYLRELLMLKDLIFWWPLQVVINSTLQFDSIILLTAFTMSYKNCLNDGLANAKALTKFVLDKYMRLMPSIMVMVALVIVLPLVYRGPVWNDYVLRQSDVCQSVGWLNTVFLQNYLPYQQICLPQTWLFCVEFQLVLLMAPLVYYLNKNYMSDYNKQSEIVNFGTRQEKSKFMDKTSKKLNADKPFFWIGTVPGIILNICIAVGLIGSFYNVYSKNLPPSWFYTMPDPDSKSLYFSEHMMRLWTHLAVFSVGILAGLECRRATRNVIRGYRGTNIGLMSQSVLKQQKSLTSSSSSLPVMMTHSDSMSSGKSTNNDLIGSSITINLGANNRLDESMVNLNEDNIRIRSRSLCSKLLDYFACLIAVLIMVAIIFSTHEWSIDDLPDPMTAAIFDAVSRCLWSLAMVWLMYMISVPNEDRKFSWLSRALGHPVMVCLGKLSFLVYLIYPLVHTTVLAIQEQPVYSSWLMMFHILIGNITITVLLSLLMSLFVEMPCRNLFRRCGTSILLTHTIGISDSTTTTTSMKPAM